MARPTVREDFTHDISTEGSFNVAQKKRIQDAFRKGVTGKVVGSDQTVASSTTLTSLTDLSFNVKKGKKYRLHAVLFTNGTGATGGIKATLTHSGQSSPTFYGTTIYSAVAGQTTESLTTASATGVAAAVLRVVVDGYFVPDANGMVTVQFAQNTSNGTGAVVKAGSFCRVHRA